LDPLIGKAVIKTGERQSGPVKIRAVDHPGQPLPPPYAAQIEGIMLLEINVDQIQNSKLLLRHALIIAQGKSYDKTV
jgi:hypothetical protein